MNAIKNILANFKADSHSPHDELVQKALHLARLLQERATALQTPQEKRQQAELDRLLQNPRDKATLTQMTDQAFRSKTPHRAVDHPGVVLDGEDARQRR